MTFGVVRSLGGRLALGLFVCALSAHAATFPQNVQGVITKIVDGDTVNVTPKAFYNVADTLNLYAAGDDNLIRVRMLGMDAAELHFPAPGHGIVGQKPFGEEALAYLQKMIKVGSPVVLQTWGLDKYGRTLAYVVANRVDINLQMVRGGYAVPYEICSGRTCTRQWFKDNRIRDYLASCDAARQERRGIYNPARPLKELPFEFRLRMGGREADKWVGNYDTLELYEPADYKKVDVCRRIFFTSKSEALKIGFKEVGRH